MTRDNLLRLLLAAADDLSREFDHAEIVGWPTGAVAHFEGMGILRQSSNGLLAPCPNCTDGHIEPVVARTRPDGTTGLFIRCPEDLRVEVSAAMCQGWEIDPDGLTHAVGAAMNIRGSLKAMVPDRLWRLGRIPWNGKTREVLFAIRLRDDDAATIVGRVPPGGRSIVLVPHHQPDDRIWPTRVSATVALSRVATLEDNQLVIDGVTLIESVLEADDAIADRSELPLDAVAAQTVAKHVKATIESMTTNDALVQAYRVHGSYRKAADALNKQGYVTNRWAVERAVKAAGGPAKVKESRDSASIPRTVASQSRDRAKKAAMYRM